MDQVKEAEIRRLIEHEERVIVRLAESRPDMAAIARDSLRCYGAKLASILSLEGLPT